MPDPPGGSPPVGYRRCLRRSLLPPGAPAARCPSVRCDAMRCGSLRRGAARSGAGRCGGGRRVSAIARPGTRRWGGRGEARSLPAAAEGSRAAAAAPREIFAWEEAKEIPFPLLAPYLGAGPGRGRALRRRSSRRGAQPTGLPPPPAARPSGGYEGVLK